MGKLRIKIKRPNIAYPGSFIQQGYAEGLEHGYLLWELDKHRSWDVSFRPLPNPSPYVTFDWQGDVDSTVAAIIKAHPQGSRFRIYNKDILSQRDVVELMSRLRIEAQAVEVTFKTDQHVERDVITSGTTTLIKEDLRSVEVILRLLKDYHRDVSVSDEEWVNVGDLVKDYLGLIKSSGDDESVRNTTWSMRQMSFDNVFVYGEGNTINFDSLNGIVGIFGPNRSGKSSIVGTIMYALFNSTDRGAIKNLHVINARKPHCYAKAVINVNGTNYVIERQTIKHENRNRQPHASTSLNVFRVENEEVIDLAGEERKDTERVIRKLIGSPEDFLLTSLSAQDEIKMFISQGSTKRRQNLSKFLDLDIFDKMYDHAKADLNSTKALLKSFPDRDWSQLSEQFTSRSTECDLTIKNCDNELFDAKEKLEVLRTELASYQEFTPVTKTQVDQQRKRVLDMSGEVVVLNAQIEESRQEIEKNETKIISITSLLRDYDLTDLKKRLDMFRTLESSVSSLRHMYEKETTLFKQQQRSLMILDDVPCGDQFPKCKFIKDAHLNKSKIADQKEKTSLTLERVKTAEESLDFLKKENLQDQVMKVELLNSKLNQLQVFVSRENVKLVKLETLLESYMINLESARLKLQELEEALKNDENAEVVKLRSEIDGCRALINNLDVKRLAMATEQGRIQIMIDKHMQEKSQRDVILRQMNAHELITTAFHRKGIPHSIVTSQLPLINAEISKILHGIVDFTVEFEADVESDAMDVYINYGDSRRIIELGSGMEKMIASVAIRVALINVSSLPKTDMFIIDEGFGSLDESGVEACGRLITSLKEYFRLTLLITHVEGIKDYVDQIIDVQKKEKDSFVCVN